MDAAVGWRARAILGRERFHPQPHQSTALSGCRTFRGACLSTEIGNLPKSPVLTLRCLIQILGFFLAYVKDFPCNPDSPHPVYFCPTSGWRGQELVEEARKRERGTLLGSATQSSLPPTTTPRVTRPVGGTEGDARGPVCRDMQKATTQVSVKKQHQAHQRHPCPKEEEGRWAREAPGPQGLLGPEDRSQTSSEMREKQG